MYVCVYLCMYVAFVCIHVCVYLCIYKGHTMNFQTFFVWAFKIIVDS